ncbi:MAG: metallophosphoesterase, partial [Bacteroidota bacterium]
MKSPSIRRSTFLIVFIININLVFGQNFAIISDIHGATPSTLSVCNLVKNWSPDFIITCGDNNYASVNAIDTQVGQFYHEFISPYLGVFGVGDTINRFFSGLGNHDVESGGISSYLPYVNLPGNERYYDFVRGYVHFFCINSNIDEPDGVADTSIQAQWLHAHLSASTSLYNIVYFHHPPYSSGLVHGSTTYMQWPFIQWGASAVFSGHDHIYERLNIGGLPYFICGTGGGPLYSVNPIPGSEFINNTNHGAMWIVANADSMVLKFINTGDTLIDEYYIVPGIPAHVENQFYSEPFSVNIYPNPALQNVTVSFANYEQDFVITITDVFGRILFHKDYTNNNCKFETVIQNIDVKALSCGNYFINVHCQNKTVT